MKELLPNEVWEERDSFELIDVRRPDEFTGELGHVPGSKLIVLDVLPEALESLPKDKTYVFICRSGARSGKATAFAHSLGFKSVFNMTGGMILWNEHGLPVSREVE